MNTVQNRSMSPWINRWQALSRREQRLLVAAGLAVVAAALWWWAVAPAWAKWKAAPEGLQAASMRWTQMQVMAAEARQLRTTAAGAGSASVAARGQAAGVDETTRAALSRALGGQTLLQPQGRNLVIDFDGARPEGLREALRTIRQRLKVQLVEVEVVTMEAGLKGRLRLEWTEP